MIPDEIEVIVQPVQTVQARQAVLDVEIIINTDIMNSNIIGRGYGGTYAYGEY